MTEQEREDEVMLVLEAVAGGRLSRFELRRWARRLLRAIDRLL